MTEQRRRTSTLPGIEQPEVLIFLRIPKTGGNTMDFLFEHCMPMEYFHGHVGPARSALLVRETDRIAEKFALLPAEKRQAVRALIGIHVAMDVERIFDRPCKFFTIVREPVDRAISNFFHNRTQPHLPSYRFIKDLSLDEYLDSGIGLDAHNHQVRMLSGCPELDAPWDPQGGRIVAPPVEAGHLEMAKRNIEDRFVVAAPLERFGHLVWFLKRLYDWPVRRMLFDVKNENPARKSIGGPAKVSAETRERLAEWNRYDAELYRWVRERFEAQLRPFEPEFSRQVERFERVNRFVQRFDALSPSVIRSMGRRVLFPARRDLFADGAAARHG